MAENCQTTLVVAAALRDSRHRLLLQQRPLTKHHGGLWEFPGGKVEPGEDLRCALHRELAEELGLALQQSAMQAAGFAEDSRSSGQRILLLLYSCHEWQGAPEGREGQSWGWFTANEAQKLPLPPMDRALLEFL